jgi:hypothetical protein
VKRLVALFAGGLGIGALLSRRRRRPALAPTPADELRSRLAESKAMAGEREHFEAGETPVDQVPDVDSRRADVHQRARQTIDELGDSS